MKKSPKRNLFILILLILFFSGCSKIIQPYEKNEPKVKNEVKSSQQTKNYPPSPKKEINKKPGGFTYTVVKGDTLWDISRRFDSDIDDIASYNKISDASLIFEGQKLFIPGTRKTGVPENNQKKNNLPPVSPKNQTVKPNTPKPPVTKSKVNTTSFNFLWPLKNSGRSKVTSLYGQRVDPILNVTTMHTGIDIDANLGDPVLASASGTVVFSGSMKGYGNMVILRHQDEWYTVYAHLNEITISKDQKVKQGELIGKAGRTGLATGVHLHFEIRDGKESKNPLLFLP
ncbi:MAG: M23 family metallopeptidase [bacterium]|nr:M23 family metallopeptidase [bacterium]